jgi:acetylxylan esterase
MLFNLIALSSLFGSILATPLDLGLEKRQSCPSVHVFGARGTTVPPGYGLTITIVNEILSAYPGSTSEAITYPACGGQSSCGGASYSSSVAQGIQAVASAVNAYNSKCPQTKLVLIGYSQVSYAHCCLN